MKNIYIISDTHGHNEGIIKVIREGAPPDLIIHLGDHYDDGLIISKETACPWIGVRGNCDHNTGAPDFRILNLEGHRIFLTHGHLYGVKHTLIQLKMKAMEVGADMVLFGHTHMPCRVRDDGILYLNPGSMALPRAGYEKTYMELSLSDKVEVLLHEVI